MPFMKAPYASEIRSTAGHYIPAEAGQVRWVPPACLAEATAIGWQVVEGEEPAVEAPEQLSHNVTESPRDLDAEFQVDLDQAVLRIITRNEASDYKSDGTPKLNSVVAEMSPDVKKRPTATQIVESYERLQENMDLVEK